MKRHKVYNKRAEDLMKRLFEKQGIGEVNFSVKETEVVKTEEEGFEDEEEGFEDEERDFDMDIKDAQQIYDEVEQALMPILGENFTESIMAVIEDEIKDFAMEMVEARNAKMEEIKKSKIAATQEEINSLKAKLESIKNDEGEIVEETEDSSEEK
jgi:hypothetical protein